MRMWTGHALAIVALAGAVGGVSVFAPFHSASFAAHAQEAQSDYVCMQRMTTGRRGGDALFKAILRPSFEAAFSESGYEIAECGALAADVITYRDQLCGFADNAPSSIAHRFASVHGISARQLCNAVR